MVRIRRDTDFAIYLDPASESIIVRATSAEAAETLAECDAERHGTKHPEGTARRPQARLALVEMFEAVHLYEHAQNRMLVREVAHRVGTRAEDPKRAGEPGRGGSGSTGTERPSQPRRERVVETTRTSPRTRPQAAQD